MDGGTQPSSLAAFLRDITESISRNQQTIEDQTKDGIAVWCHEVNDFKTISSDYFDQPSSNSSSFLTVPHPGDRPSEPNSQPDGDIRSEDPERPQPEMVQWERHKEIYDSLFAARTPPDAMELVVASGLLCTKTEQGDFSRHLCVAPAEIVLDRSNGTLTVEAIDDFDYEINWTPGEIRTQLTDDDQGLDNLTQAQSYDESQDAVSTILPLFGTKGYLISDPKSQAKGDHVGIGALPAVLLRKKDTSSLLKTLRDMASEMQSGGYVSDPFKMLADPRFQPSQREAIHERALLALPANPEQRSMINRARTETHMVVQGPPGTGKTHTIANLASVLMGEGRRVLITAENERALAEVQSKLPESMRALMLPMLKERSTGALEASVNALSTRANSGGTEEQREQEIKVKISQLSDIEEKIYSAEQRLVEIAGKDRAEGNLQGVTLTLAGHQQRLLSLADDLKYIDRFLSGSEGISQDDASIILELFPVVDESHETLRAFQLPDDLITPSELSSWIKDYRGQLAVLGDPSSYDYSDLAERLAEIALLSTRLHQVPTTHWSEVAHTTVEYSAAAVDCREQAQFVNHGVTLASGVDRAPAIATMESYLSLDPKRFDDPVTELLNMYERARVYVGSVSSTAEFVSYNRSLEFTQICDESLQLLLKDRSNLLNSYVKDLRISGQSEIGLLVDEAKDLIENSRPKPGLPVKVLDGAPPSHELLRQAKGLRDHFESGGKLKGVFGVPKPVKDAKELIEFVRVDESTIDSPDEAVRAVDEFMYRMTITKIDTWASENRITRPENESHFEWLNAIISLSDSAPRVIVALRQVEELVVFPPGEPQAEPEESLRLALATVSQELVSSLADLANSYSRQSTSLRLDGYEVDSRSNAEVVLASLKACETRERFWKFLPDAWKANCNPLDIEDDTLVRNLELCSEAARIPGAARTVDLTPSAVNSIIERTRSDQLRKKLEAEHDHFIGKLRQTLTKCEPMSPATRAIADSLQSEDATAYQLATVELKRERDMYEKAMRLEDALAKAVEVHPLLVEDFKLGNEDAKHSLSRIDELQKLRDYRVEITEWQRLIGSSGPIHQELSKLDAQKQNIEQEIAGLRCWNSAVSRIQSKRDLKSALSALTVAMDKVPKTRTAKTFRTRMRALRSATQAAAPAIPCWVMTIDRVTEVLGYPKDEDRFDVVIVDEASQAWFPSMFLYAIADQVVIVGDDLQTSPSQTSMTEEQIRSIVSEHIPEHRLADQIGGDLSLYDVAAVMTGPDTLVDHFRCVPEIISLSNRLSYGPKGKTLKPSRVREPGSLSPPVVHQYVNGSRASSKSANPKEVQAVVEQVVKCHGDPRYSGMDFGVVVVGTYPQAHLKSLNEKLLELLGPAAMDERKLEVGTPSQFQGAERNVMFLSLLDAPQTGDRIRVWPHEHAGRNRRRVQHLNVAVSRAKDQLWIFRSFKIEDLAPNDARVVILQDENSIPPTLESQLENCDSGFEQDVVRALADKDPSLVIRTQVEAIGYKIDIVIEDENGRRLAVECDGWPWHTEALDIRKDLYRQRTLEKLGWEFFRFLSYEWYANPRQITNEIIQHLGSVELKHEESPLPNYPEIILSDDDDEQIENSDFFESEQEEVADETPIISDMPDLSTPDRPTDGMTKKEINRHLAEAMKKIDTNPRGEAWERAKQLLKNGETFDEAAEGCTG